MPTKIMARLPNFSSTTRSRPPAALAVWSSAVAAVLFLFLLAMNSSTSSRLLQLSDSEPAMSIAERRARLYEKMAWDLSEHGATFLKGGETSQSLSLSDIFQLKDGAVTPVLKAANPPVRANVLYLGSEFSIPISEAVKDIFLPYFDGVIWFQNTSIYHSSMFHASHHLTPVIATDDEIEAEADEVKGVAETLCPLKIVLDRVVLTSTGVLLACWQVTSGTDPSIIRAKLRSALPRAPEKQLYDTVLLHTSLARLLGPPKVQLEKKEEYHDQLQLFYELVAKLNDKLHAFKATISELWFVEEFDILALALNGRMKTRRFHLGCNVN